MKCLLFFLISIPAFAQPDWVNNVPTQVGNTLSVSCHGTGPDDATAYESALNECRNVASQTLLQSFQVNDLTVQTEKDSAYHSEIVHQLFVDGLKCEVKQVYTGSNEKWIMCWFDTSKVKVSSVRNASSETLFNKEEGSVVLVVAPGCDTILVRGVTPRLIGCAKNPITVRVRPGDLEIVVRMKGYLPKHIPAREWANDKVISVYLDRL